MDYSVTTIPLTEEEINSAKKQIKGFVLILKVAAIVIVILFATAIFFSNWVIGSFALFLSIILSLLYFLTFKSAKDDLSKGVKIIYKGKITKREVLAGGGSTVIDSKIDYEKETIFVQTKTASGFNDEVLHFNGTWNNPKGIWFQIFLGDKSFQVNMKDFINFKENENVVIETLNSNTVISIQKNE